MPRIYVASLSDYNAGRLHGEWIDAAQDVDAIWAEVNAMLEASPEPGAEEWAIHDHEGFEGWSPSEWESFETVSAVALAIDEHGGAFAAFLANRGVDLSTETMADVVEEFGDRFVGEWSSLEDYVSELIEEGCYGDELMKVYDEHPSYVATDRMARDLELGGDYYTADTPAYKVWVFRSY